jgi:DNA repair protein RecN (Recombination protein N)
LLRSLRIENLVLIRAAELDLAAGLNALTGETGAGKTIFAQAIGLLLGARGDAGAIGPAGEEAYVEAELDVPDGFLDDEGLAALAELRPGDEPGLVIARRIFADGRTRAYAWGRAVAREDLAAAAERLIAMSGQFEQRRLARPSYQLDLLDAFCGNEQTGRRDAARAAWRALGVARRRYEEVTQDAGAAAARLEELHALVQSTEGLEHGEEDALRTERARLLHASELVHAVAAAADALAPEDGEGAVSLTAQAERALEPAAGIAPELAAPLEELRELVVRLGETGSELRRAVSSFETDPARLEAVETRLDRIAELRRRFRCDSTEELLARRDEAAAELEGLDEGVDPVEVATRELAAAETRFETAALELRRAREAAVEPFATAITEELAGLGMGEGEFRVELREQPEGQSGRDAAVFLIRLNRGLPFAPVADTASGGELSRIALALATVAARHGDAGGQTLVFDEIDAGIGGETAHRVAETLQRLASRAQVVTITHLPQIASVADAHFRVEKVAGDPTRTVIERLDDAQRRDELERMLGGQEFLATVSRPGDSGSA